MAKVDKKAAFLAAYAECGNVTRAAEIVGMHRNSHYLWLETDPDYPALFREAEQQACDRLEQEARRRAVEGLRRLKFGRDGKPLIDPETGKPYYEHEYSDTLLIFLLKGARPEKYADRLKNEHSGPDGGVIEMQVTSRVAGLSPEEKASLLAELRQADDDQADDLEQFRAEVT